MISVWNRQRSIRSGMAGIVPRWKRGS